MDFAARTAAELKNRWRGFQPWPGAFTSLNGKKLIVQRMDVAECPDATTLDPGRVLIRDARLFAACAQHTWLELVEVQVEGRKRMLASEFLRGLPSVAQSELRLG